MVKGPKPKGTKRYKGQLPERAIRQTAGLRVADCIVEA